jgi:hypothetical protein
MSTEVKSVENKKPSFKNKLVAKAAKLPEPNESIAVLVKSLEQLTLDDLEAVRAYADYEMRRKTLESAVEVEWKPVVGDRITVKNCELVRFNGCSGVVQKVSRIRCIVTLDDGRHGYFFLSNVFPADGVVEAPAVSE